MRAVRLWAVRHAALMERPYGAMTVALRGLRPLARVVGAQRLEKPVAGVERAGASTWLPIITGELTAPRPAVDATVRPAGSPLQLLASGAFVVTAEFAPPDSADPAAVLARLDPFRGNVDALNVTHASGANCHMSSAAVSVLLAQAGCEPVMQVTCRDRNRIAIQGDLLGAAALGVRNVLCLTGDHVGNGDHPGARHVGDLDSVTLLAAMRRMRDAGELIRAIRGIAGIAGVHLMAHRQERLLPSIIKESGVFAGRVPLSSPPQPQPLSPPQPAAA